MLRSKILTVVSQNFRWFSQNAREKMNYDVVTVGAGPSGLSAAIRLKQLAIEKNMDITVCVVEKGSEVGSHIISGNVFEPKGLDELFPNWRKMPDIPINTRAVSDSFLFLTEKRSYEIPHILLPSQLKNDGNYIISLSHLVRWLSQQAESLGIEIYSGFAASEVLYTSDGAVRGIAIKDVGISKTGAPKANYTAGVELLARQTIFAEGSRGSCSEEIIEKFSLRQGCDVQSYALGLKEVWQAPPDHPYFKPGKVQHTLGWPLQKRPWSNEEPFGGSFMYHMEPNIIHIGMVIGLDYKNTYLNPYQEFQQWKHHPDIIKYLKDCSCISYGARVVNKGGYHAIPQLTFPGGLLVGCSAGFLNVTKIKGSHTAIKSGMIAAEEIFSKLSAEGQSKAVATNGCVLQDVDTPEPIQVTTYDKKLRESWIGKELYEIRNVHAAFKYGLVPGFLHTTLSCLLTKGHEPWTLTNSEVDSRTTKLAKDCVKIEYPKPDGVISFDLLTNLQRSGTQHDHDQPSHLVIKDNMKDIPTEISLKRFDGPEERFCPAGVYEYTASEPDLDSVESTGSPGSSSKSLVINAQNCVHCKCCSIKMPQEYIKWTVPEGGGGPSYTLM